MKFKIKTLFLSVVFLLSTVSYGATKNFQPVCLKVHVEIDQGRHPHPDRLYNLVTKIFINQPIPDKRFFKSSYFEYQSEGDAVTFTGLVFSGDEIVRDCKAKYLDIIKNHPTIIEAIYKIKERRSCELEIISMKPGRCE